MKRKNKSERSVKKRRSKNEKRRKKRKNKRKKSVKSEKKLNELKKIRRKHKRDAKKNMQENFISCSKSSKK